MSVNRKLFIKFLNGELLEIYYHPEDELDAIHEHILDCKPELHNYEFILFHLNEEEEKEIGTNRIHDVHQLSDGSVIGIYIRKKPHIEILFIEPLNLYNINRINFDGYCYNGMIQKYKAILYMNDEDETIHDFIFYYDKYSQQFAYENELHSLDVSHQFRDRGRASMEGYCKWPSIEHMIVNNSSIILPSQIKMQKIMEYAPLFNKEWNINLSHFAKQC